MYLKTNDQFCQKILLVISVSYMVRLTCRDVESCFNMATDFSPPPNFLIYSHTSLLLCVQMWLLLYQQVIRHETTKESRMKKKAYFVEVQSHAAMSAVCCWRGSVSSASSNAQLWPAVMTDNCPTDPNRTNHKHFPELVTTRQHTQMYCRSVWRSWHLQHNQTI